MTTTPAERPLSEQYPALRLPISERAAYIAYYWDCTSPRPRLPRHYLAAADLWIEQAIVPAWAREPVADLVAEWDARTMHRRDRPHYLLLVEQLLTEIANAQPATD